jgi:peptide-methionine (S)-S-oxide reductase
MFLRLIFTAVFGFGLIVVGTTDVLAQPPASEQALSAESDSKYETAIFAGGCFWCMESAFDPVEGVVETISGYTGGRVKDPTYEKVKKGRTGHYEALKVVYDPKKTSYETLLGVFWRNIDPFNARGQFCDTGSQYRAAIFVDGAQQQSEAEASRDQIASRTKLKIVTEILPASEFYPAEAYHQDYYLKNPIQYRFYRNQCGRDRRLVQIWGAQAGGH